MLSSVRCGLLTEDAADRPKVLHQDDGTLVAPLDIAVGSRNIHVADKGSDEKPGAICEIKAGGKLHRFATATPVARPVAITADPVTDDLLVLETETGALLSIEHKTGAVTVLCSGFSVGGTDALRAGLDTTPDGRRVFITDRGLGRIFTLTRTPGE